MTARHVARPSVLRGVPLDRHAVIEASAGTGKTFTLEHLVVELVLTADVTLDRILVVTFTEKATNELRVRVRAKLEELLAGRVADADEAQVRAGDFWTLDDAARARLARALHGFDGATIATIHAFCQRVLRENAFASGRLFEEQQVDGRDTFGRALRDALRSDIARDPARAVWLGAALQAGWSIADLESLLWSCTQAKGELRPVFDPATLDAAVAAFPVDDARRMEGKEAMRSWGLPAPTMRKLGNELYQLALTVERAREGGGSRTLVLDPGEVDLDYLVEKLPGILPRPGPTGLACSAALDIARATPSLAAAVAGSALPAVRAELARRKRQAGQYDFDDMLSLVDDALRGPRGGALVRRLRDRWRFVLIDEFQDTDETQWDIFRRAFFEPDASGKSTVFLVGDPKQSIYRFRGADVETFLAARDQVARSGGETLRLERNFRATPSLVEATNALFAQDAAPFFTGSIRHEPVTCGKTESTLVDGDGRAVTPLHLLRFEREIVPTQLGALVAREIRGITDPARPWRLDGRALEHHDVFILTRTKNEGRAMGAALRAAGIPHAFFKEDGLFQTDEAREIRTLLAAIQEPAHRARRVAAWMTRFFDLSLADLERTRDIAPTHPYVARLQGWKALADTRDFERLFESIVQESGVLRREIFFADGERALTNTTHILELLLEHARRTPGTLGDLLHVLSGLVEATRMPLDMEGNVQRLESERRAVQIMTIHKAKGLEAAVVFVAGGWSPGRSDQVHVVHEDGRRLAWVGTMRGDVKARAKEEEREEEQRLMYVALTRAKGRLYLPVVRKEGAAVRLRGPYDAVNRRLADLATGSPLATVEDPPRLVVLLGPSANDAASEAWRPPAELLAREPVGDHAALREQRAGAVVTSYTRMRGARAGARSAWGAEEVQRRAEKGEEIDAARGPVLRSARASGVFVHEVLERISLASFEAADFESWCAMPEVAALFDEAIAIHRVDPAQRGHAQQLVWSAFTTAVPLPGGAALARLASAERVVREMEFVFPVAVASAYVRGSLDMAFDHAGRTYFVDWKTDSLPGYDAVTLERHVSSHYEEQVTLYALATVKLLGVRSREEHDARFGGILYCFLRGFGHGGQGLWSARPEWAQLKAREGDLSARWRRQS